MTNHEPWIENGKDIIGDIHGHARELETLLAVLGYREVGSTYYHPEGRRVIFLGDYIDRGPAIRRTLEIVRGMVEAGDALAILGNHEINAMRFHTTGSDGKPLRPHTPKNVGQHAETLRQIPDREEMADWMRWFATLPLAIEMPGLRVVHACWDESAVREMSMCGPLTGQILERFSIEGSVEHETISRLVNGPEAWLPEGFLHRTADGTMRPEIRVKWWQPLDGLTCREAIFPENEAVPDLPPVDLPELAPYDDACPTFFGHYALKSSIPSPIGPRLACLDYGTGKGGFLCAYRWDGEQELDAERFLTANFVKKPKKSAASPGTFLEKDAVLVRSAKTAAPIDATAFTNQLLEARSLDGIP